MVNLSFARRVLRFYSNHICLVFADEKLMKEIMIYTTVRIYVKKGTTPSHKLSSVNSKNRFNILTTIHVTGKHTRPVEYVILEDCTDSTLF